MVKPISKEALSEVGRMISLTVLQIILTTISTGTVPIET